MATRKALNFENLGSTPSSLAINNKNKRNENNRKLHLG